ncbi:CocE/NonD family hydrolase [Frigidibacter albus]|uniref:CocE/NonD family hydrolase n=1 Tax=Frigidibacter albus TaxID=1465486 RepID=A0A6L8VK88_9RHOB|nr:CocE/NonD family hydrolase [Frigidibacter albus]MZQ90201.1 CocE/NonD family hydrolase [Frigidibacter albus]NBE32301.1 CocE/NonD family hydrolase [Frigidibacter albus]GGH58101.1 peptidase S15 [Frigidibacter albus]
MKTVTDFPHEVTETPLVWITLPDGTRLAARLWLPDGAADSPVPAILEYLPYRRRDGTAPRDQLTHPYLAGHGHACLRVDMRGNGDSDGLMADEYTAQELADGVEVIDWIARQPWCSGAVGMMGISWGGFNALQMAALAPPALKAIITLCSTVDRYADDIHYKGGCMLGENLGWAGTMWSFSSRPPDPDQRPDDWRELWLSRLENEPFLAATWFRHQRRDAYWRHGSICEDYSAIRAAVMAVGGWGDSYKNAVPQLVENISAPVRGIIGPWIHKYPHFASPEPRIGFLQEALRWWDRHLKGLDTGVDEGPAYAVYMLDGGRPATWYSHRPGHWVAEPVWPRPDAQPAQFVLGHSPQGHGTLGSGAPFEVPLASPEHCGMDSGEFCAIFLGPEMPGDQRRDDALSACFDSAPLGQTDILGAPTLRLRLKSDRPVAHVAVRLNHVHPDGASTRITWGVLNLCHRTSHAEPEPMIPGEETEVEVPLDHIAYRLPEGHRLRVAVSSTYFPMIWPSPRPVTLTLTGGALDLPVRPSGDGDEITLPEAEAAAPLQLEVIRPEAHIRRSEIDQQSGRISLVIEDDFGEARDTTHGLISGSVLRERWEICPDDPLSARALTDWTQVIERNGLRLRTEARTELFADATDFHLSGRVEAWENDRLIYARDVSETVPRDHL